MQWHSILRTTETRDLLFFSSISLFLEKLILYCSKNYYWVYEFYKVTFRGSWTKGNTANLIGFMGILGFFCPIQNSIQRCVLGSRCSLDWSQHLTYLSCADQGVNVNSLSNLSSRCARPNILISDSHSYVHSSFLEKDNLLIQTPYHLNALLDVQNACMRIRINNLNLTQQGQDSFYIWKFHLNICQWPCQRL